MTDQHRSPDSIQAKAKIGKSIGQGHPNNDVIEDHQEHTFRGLAHAVECTEIAVRDGVQNVPDADDQEICSHDIRHTVALDKKAGKLLGEPAHQGGEDYKQAAAVTQRTLQIVLRSVIPLLRFLLSAHILQHLRSIPLFPDARPETHRYLFSCACRISTFRMFWK